ncbi:MAG: hypothetical protein ACRDRO_02835 [Pseudonocardiaceae bacterium]
MRGTTGPTGDRAVLAAAQPTVLPTAAANASLLTVGGAAVRVLLAVVPAAEEPARTTARVLASLVAAL